MVVRPWIDPVFLVHFYRAAVRYQHLQMHGEEPNKCHAERKVDDDRDEHHGGAAGKLQGDVRDMSHSLTGPEDIQTHFGPSSFPCRNCSMEPSNSEKQERAPTSA